MVKTRRIQEDTTHVSWCSLEAAIKASKRKLFANIYGVTYRFVRNLDIIGCSWTVLHACNVMYFRFSSAENSVKQWYISGIVVIKNGDSARMIVSFGMVLIAKDPRPPLSDGRTSKNSFRKKLSEIGDGEEGGEVEEKDENEWEGEVAGFMGPVEAGRCRDVCCFDIDREVEEGWFGDRVRTRDSRGRGYPSQCSYAYIMIDNRVE